MRKTGTNNYNRLFLLLSVAICLIIFPHCGSKDSAGKTERELVHELIAKIDGSIIDSSSYLGSDDPENVLAVIPNDVTVNKLDRIISKFVKKYSDVEDTEKYNGDEYESLGDYRRSFTRGQNFFLITFFAENNKNFILVLWGIPLKPIINEERVEINARERMVIERLTDIRTAQIEYRKRFEKYTDDFNQLINFILLDSIQDGSNWINVKDSLFSSLSYPIDSMPYIPFSKEKKFEIYAGFIERGLTKLPVIEVTAQPEYYLIGIDIDKNNIHPPKFGSTFEAAIDGNWE